MQRPAALTVDIRFLGSSGMIQKGEHLKGFISRITTLCMNILIHPETKNFSEL